MAEEYSRPEKTKKKRIAKKKPKTYIRKTGFYYSFFTIVLIFCLIQIGYGAILNVSKIVAYKAKIATLENLLKKSQLKNEELKAEKKVVTSDNSLEGIARNNLKMAGANEVLVIINEKTEEPKPVKKKWKFKGFNFKKLENHSQPPSENMFIPPEVVEE